MVRICRVLATYVRDEENNLEVVVLGDDPEAYLQVQCALAFDEQDVSLKMDTYCLVTASGSNAVRRRSGLLCPRHDCAAYVHP